jgi:hypothetical protein
VRRLGDQIRARLDREEARLEMASTNIRDQIDEAIGMSEIELQLEERRQRLGLAGGTDGGGDSSANRASSSGS